MLRALEEWAAARGYRLACGGVGVLDDARSDLDRRRRAGELDPEFYRKRLGAFLYQRSAAAVPDPRAVIAVALPRPAHRLVFETGSGPFETILPPTYAQYARVFEDVRRDIGGAVPALAGRLHELRAPLKAVASRLGLVEYGRNNVTYVAGWGSYFQLVGYVTDVDLGLAGWAPSAPRLMAECETCRTCLSACPADAIGEDRILLHAERCTTYWSEEPGAWPRDAVCTSGNNLFGCLECQTLCPANDGLLRIEPAGAFDREETDALLAAADGAPLRADVAEKLARLGLNEQPLVARNLRQLVGQRPA